MWILIPIIFNNFILFFIGYKDKSRSKYSKLLAGSQIFNIILILSTFFIPTYKANSISVNDDLPLLFTLGFVYVTLFFFPYIITHGFVLTLYGFKNKTQYGYSLLIGGILMVFNYISMYLFTFLHGIIYMQNPLISWAMHSWFLYNFWAGFIIIPIVGYTFFLRHGKRNSLKWIQISGVVGILLILTIEVYELLAFFNVVPLFNYWI